MDMACTTVVSVHYSSCGMWSWLRLALLASKPRHMRHGFGLTSQQSGICRTLTSAAIEYGYRVSGEGIAICTEGQQGQSGGQNLVGLKPAWYVGQIVAEALTALKMSDGAQRQQRRMCVQHIHTLDDCRECPRTLTTARNARAELAGQRQQGNRVTDDAAETRTMHTHTHGRRWASRRRQQGSRCVHTHARGKHTHRDGCCRRQPAQRQQGIWRVHTHTRTHRWLRDIKCWCMEAAAQQMVQRN